MFKNKWWSWLLITIGCILSASIIIKTHEQWLFFIVGSVAYFVLDTLSVYQKRWRYNTKNGYAYWAGSGWGLLTVMAQYLYSQSSVQVISLLLLIAGIIIISRFRQEFKISNYTGSHWLPFAFLAFFLFPTLFIVSLAIGIILEYVAVVVFKTWYYPTALFLDWSWIWNTDGFYTGSFRVVSEKFFISVSYNVSWTGSVFSF